MNYALWLEFLASVAGQVAAANGANPQAIAILNLLVAGSRAGALTDEELAALKSKYEAEVAGGAPVTAEDLSEIERRLLERSASIQS